MTLAFHHLAGRPFLPGVRDCFSTIIDLFDENFGIKITNYARPVDWNADHLDLISQLHEREGFNKITTWTAKDLRPADVFCLAIGTRAPNHFAAFVGDNEIIHHVYGRLSTIELYRDFWRNSTCFVLRHPAVPDLRPVHPNTDIGSLLRDRYRPQAA